MSLIALPRTSAGSQPLAGAEEPPACIYLDWQEALALVADLAEQASSLLWDIAENQPFIDGT